MTKRDLNLVAPFLTQYRSKNNERYWVLTSTIIHSKILTNLTSINTITLNIVRELSNNNTNFQILDVKV